MTNINNLYELLKVRAKASDSWLEKFPDDKAELYRNLEMYNTLRLIESDDYFNEIKKIYEEDL